MTHALLVEKVVKWLRRSDRCCIVFSDLYSRVNRRRVGFATTSIARPPRAPSAVLIGLRSLLALDTKLPRGHCLTHIARERVLKMDRRCCCGLTRLYAFMGPDLPVTMLEGDTLDARRAFCADTDPCATHPPI